MKEKTQKKNNQTLKVQLALRILMIIAMHLLMFLLCGLMLGINKIASIVLGALFTALLYVFILFVAKGHGESDYAINVLNKRIYFNNMPLNQKLRQFSYLKGFAVVSVALFPVIIIHITALATRVIALRGIMVYFFVPITMFMEGIRVFDFIGAFAGANYTAYAIIYTLAIFISVILYSVGYFLGGYRRLLIHNKVEKEKQMKSRDW